VVAKLPPIVNNQFPILFAEDNDEQALVMQEAFRSAGWKGAVERVSNGNEAIRYLDGKEKFSDRAKFPYPALLLLDLWMPEMNGFELLKWIREQPAHATLLVFIFTHEGDDPMVRRAYDLAANCLIEKPTEFNQITTLAQKLQNYLELIQVPPHVDPAE
jgi:CheY-like chemotaxis protein